MIKMAKSRQAVVNLVKSWDGKNRTAHIKALSIYITTSLGRSALANFLVAFVCAMTGLGALVPGLH